MRNGSRCGQFMTIVGTLTPQSCLRLWKHRIPYARTRPAPGLIARDVTKPCGCALLYAGDARLAQSSTSQLALYAFSSVLSALVVAPAELRHSQAAHAWLATALVTVGPCECAVSLPWQGVCSRRVM